MKMKEKKDCKIVQDLLPNYVEKLTNEETNQYIKEHLAECKECNKIYENMQKDLGLHHKRSDAKAINYMKKYNHKLKTLKIILLIIFLLFVVVVGRKTWILSSLSHKAQETETQETRNFRSKVINYKDGEVIIWDSYSKGDVILLYITTYGENTNKKEQIIYKSSEEKFVLTDDGETKTMKELGDVFINPISFTSDLFLENIWLAMTTSLEKITLQGQECYMIRDGDMEKFINPDTGLAIKLVDNVVNRTSDYYYEFGNVTDEDVARPDTTGYVVEE